MVRCVAIHSECGGSRCGCLKLNEAPSVDSASSKRPGGSAVRGLGGSAAVVREGTAA